jgi:hypothetical protein
MYLTDEYSENYSVYAETGKMFLYEYNIANEVIYQGINYDKLEITFDELEAQIYEDITNRTGRADEIGSDAYIDELGQINKPQ